MENKKSVIVKLVLAALAVFAANTAAAQIPQISITNATVYPEGNTFALVNLTDFNDFGAGIVEVYYDPITLWVTDANLGFAGYGGTLTPNLNNATVGRTRFLITTNSQPGPNGPLTLLNLSIKGRGPVGRTSNLGVVVPQLTDSDGIETPTIVANETFRAASLQNSVNTISMPKNVVIRKGTIAKLPIKVYSSTGVAAVGINVSYDPGVVNVYTAETGDFTRFFGFNNQNAIRGWVWINTYIIGTQIAGDSTVVNITIEGLGNSGNVAIIKNSILAISDSYGNDLPVDVTNRTVTLIPYSDPNDFTGDNQTNILDLQKIVNNFDPNTGYWYSAYDVTQDEKVNEDDIYAVGQNFTRKIF